MSPPLASIQSQINPIYVPSPHFFRINFNIILPSTPVSSKWLLRSGIPTKISYYFLLSSMRATCLVHLILHNFTTRIFVEANNLWSSALRSLLKFPVISSLFGTYVKQKDRKRSLSGKKDNAKCGIRETATWQNFALWKLKWRQWGFRTESHLQPLSEVTWPNLT